MTAGTPESATTDVDAAHRSFRDELINKGLLIPMGIDGLFGRGAAFEKVVDGVDAVVRRKGQAVQGNSATILRFPPLYSREAFECTDYMASFPNLTGSVSTFTGGDREHRALLEDREAGNGWDQHLHPAGTMLVSAACHPSYGTLEPLLPPDGRLLDVYGYCFRHEPAMDPARMQAFRMHEYVRVGTPEQAVAHRDQWITHGMDVLRELGLDAEAAAANDPFFGRAGRILAANQHAESLKTELVVRLYGDLTEGTALVSSNYHQDHFGTTFALRTANGEVAHSACIGFGMERIALAMLRTHGLDPDSWPRAVRSAMAE